MRVLLSGATGLLGGAVLERLSARGDDVLAISRRPPDAKMERVEWLEADLTTAGSWQAEVAARPVDAVVHLVGEPLDGGRWTRARKELLRASRVDTTRHLVEAATRSASLPRVLVSGAAVAIYGARGEETLDERATPGRGFMAELCQQWEEETARASHAGVRTVSLRLAPVVSVHGGALARMAKASRLFVGGPLGDPEAWFPWIHEDDLVGLVLHALQGALAGPVNAVAPQQVRMREVAQTLGRVLRRPAWIAVPTWGLRLLFGEMTDVITTGQKVVPEAALASGYRYVHPTLEEALRAAFGGK
jgi:uncharacterized protein (TIGR01777 family)